MLTPRVTDISHHNTVTSLRAAAQAGIWGVIHKATQGTGYRDPTYVQRRPLAASAGLLWGAYHFGDSSDPIRQVDYFLDYAKPDARTLLCLDYEDHPTRSRTMRPEQMVAFLREIERRTGRRAMLYSGNVIKENIGRLSPQDRDYVTQHMLWLCQYGLTPRLPPGFRYLTLWQYTDGRVGPQPHTIPGISGEVDLNVFNGERGHLESLWQGPITNTTVPSTDLSSQRRAASSRGSDDAPDDNFEGTDVPQQAPPIPPPSPGNGGPPLNVQPVYSRYSVEVEVAQRELIAMGYHEVGDVDGHWGGKTAAGIKAFFVDRGVNDAVAEPGARLNQEISRAKAEGFSRPIAPSRANATPKDLAPKNEAVQTSLWQQFCAKVAAGFAALGLTGSTLSGWFEGVKEKTYAVREFFYSVPPEVWFVVIGVVAGIAWYASKKTATAVTKDYNTGRLN